MALTKEELMKNIQDNKRSYYLEISFYEEWQEVSDDQYTLDQMRPTQILQTVTCYKLIKQDKTNTRYWHLSRRFFEELNKLGLNVVTINSDDEEDN